MTRLHVAMEEELVVVSGQKGRWQMDSRLVGTRPQCVAADPLRPEWLYCGTFGQGLWRSRDSGLSWERIGESIPQSQITSVAVSEIDRAGEFGILWAGSEPSSLFRSEDGGESWEELKGLRQLPSEPTWSFPPRPYTHHVRWITPDPLVAGRLFVCIEAEALVRSLDGGLSWEDRRPDAPKDTHTLRAHRLAPGRLYSAAGDGFMAPGMGYAESHDAGITWQRFGSGLHRHYLWSVAVGARNPDRIVVSAARSPAEAHNPGMADSTIYRREDEGEWQEILAGLPDPRGTVIPELAASEAEPEVFYLASNRGVFRSEDAGLSRERLDIPWPGRFQHQHVRSLIAVE